MVGFSLMIFILKEITAICSLPLSEDRFIQIGFDYAAWQTHCFSLLAIKVKKKENSVVNGYLTEVWGTNTCYTYKTGFINRFETNKDGKSYVDCIPFNLRTDTFSC